MTAMVAMGGYAVDSNKLHVKIDAKSVGDTLLVVLNDIDKPDMTAIGKSGVFEFDVTLQEVKEMLLVEPSLLRRAPGKYYIVPAVPGYEMVLTQEAGVNRYDVTGTGFYAKYHEADLLIEEAQKPLAHCNQEDIPRLKKEANDKMMGYIKANAGDETSAWVLMQFDDVELMKEAVALLTPAVRDGRFKALFQERIDSKEARKKADEESEKLQAAGRVAPEFTLNDINGKPLALSSLRGKYVILDFWGSWCGWCIKGIPDMKEYYKKYAGKFEILGIDCNDTEAKWKDAVKKHELPWLHVYNTKTSTVLADYGIQGFPTKIIIDPEGKIVKTIVGEDPAFYSLLDELFK